ncbi:MAG: hypothetical protein ABI885_22830, partial [Gammaproteobacteria bacterium]
MQRSLQIAAQSTKALEDVAEATRANTMLLQPMLAKQMRAYVAVDHGRATFQDENLRFDSAPVFTNTGFTPARNVCYSAVAEILATDQPEAFVFAQAELKRNDA